jgi:hypothetical protein
MPSSLRPNSASIWASVSDGTPTQARAAASLTA